MNSYEAKRKNLYDLLNRLGYQPYGNAKRGGQEYWYLSPFRNESKPSFHITFKGNIWVWKDFGHNGTKSGGHIIDFIQELKGLDFKGALAFLRDVYQADLFERHPAKGRGQLSQHHFLFQAHLNETKLQQEQKLKLLKASPLQNKTIFQYLCNRCIPASIATKYLQEVQYLNVAKNKIYFAFGMKNEQGGYEIRAASDTYPFKSVLGKRNLTFIKGQSNTKHINVFEGMLDALSFIVFSGRDVCKEDMLIMHSTSTFQKAATFIQDRNYSMIKTYMDNDDTGQGATDKFIKLFDDRTIPLNRFYEGYNDVNDFLVARRGQNSKMDAAPLPAL